MEGRVVVAKLCCRIVNYKLCENFWGVSTAVTSFPTAIDSPLQDQLSSINFVSKFSDDLSPVQHASFEDEKEKFEASIKTSTSSEEVTTWREALIMVKNCKDKKLTSRISTDNQLLQLAQVDVAFKKQMLEKTEKSDNELDTELANLNQIMSNIGSSMQQDVGVLGRLLSNQSRVFPSPTPFSHTRDFLPNVQPTSTSTLVGPQPSSQESDNVDDDQSQKKYYNFF